jgi:hypothetical protein
MCGVAISERTDTSQHFNRVEKLFISRSVTWPPTTARVPSHKKKAPLVGRHTGPLLNNTASYMLQPSFKIQQIHASWTICTERLTKGRISTSSSLLLGSTPNENARENVTFQHNSHHYLGIYMQPIWQRCSETDCQTLASSKTTNNWWLLTERNFPTKSIKQYWKFHIKYVLLTFGNQTEMPMQMLHSEEQSK